MSAGVEFSRPFAVDRVPPDGARLAIEASDGERRALARRFDLVGLEALSAELELERVSAGDLLKVSGRIRADLAQTCVVTLEPVPARIDAVFERLFSREVPEPPEDDDEVEIAEDEPEPLSGDTVDLGEIVAEELVLALDPYPRSSAADQVLAELSGVDGRAAADPFGKLAALRRP